MKVTEEKFLFLKKELLKCGTLEARIVSDSMKPLIKPNDLIKIEPMNAPLKQGQIVVFKFNESLFCHIFLGVSQMDKERILTVGLNNDEIDFPILKEDCLGVVTNYKLRFQDRIRLFFKR